MGELRSRPLSGLDEHERDVPVVDDQHSTRVEIMMRRFRDQIAREKADSVQAFLNWTSPYERIAGKDVYLIADFTRFDGDEFVRNAHRALLLREPDEVALRYHLELLQSRQVTKIQLLRIIRASTEGRAAGVPVVGLESIERDATSPRRVRHAKRAGALPENTQYSATDLLAFDGEQFVRNAYLRILKRQPDPAGLDHYVEALRSGKQTRSEVLGHLRFSPEGGHVGVRVPGLAWRFRLSVASRLVGIRRFFAIGRLLVRLPNRIRELERSIERTAAQVATAEQASALAARTEQLRGASEWLGARLDEAIEKTKTLRQDLEHVQHEKALLENHVRVRSEQLDAAIAGVRGMGVDLRRQLLEHQRAIAAFRPEPDDLSHAPAGDKSGETQRRGGARLTDAFYLAFEDRFRGPRDEIKARAERYLPIVRRAAAEASDALIIDVGCGRGEWLQLLQENGIAARGVDANHAAAEACKELGLDVVHADAIAFLRECKADSLTAVSALQLIEHLPFERIIDLLDEALRVLRPGGVAIFETPNPENLRVGACNFYDDPTHQRPLPPEPLRFLAEARGFGKTEILRLHPFPPEVQLHTGDEAIREALNGALFSERDYALIAHK